MEEVWGIKTTIMNRKQKSFLVDYEKRKKTTTNIKNMHTCNKIVTDENKMREK